MVWQGVQIKDCSSATNVSRVAANQLMLAPLNVCEAAQQLAYVLFAQVDTNQLMSVRLNTNALDECFV